MKHLSLASDSYYGEDSLDTAFHGRDDYSFGIILDADFAKETVDTEILEENQRKMNEPANEELELLKINRRNPYRFRGDSCLLAGIYLDCGLWLSASYRELQDLADGNSSGAIRYNSHNVDNPRQFYTHMKLFGNWIEYTKVFRD